MGSAGQVARVLLDSSLPQLDRLLDYRVPPELAAEAAAGVRVTVPLRSAGRTASGFIVSLTSSGEFTGELSAIEAVVSPAVVLTPQVWQLARAVADRAAGTANDVVRLAVPPRQVRVEKSWLAARERSRASTENGAVDEHTEIRHGAVDAIRGYPAGAIEDALAGGQRIAVRAIPRQVRLDETTWVGEWALTTALAAAHCLAAGRSAIIAVPDYRDQGQLESALRAVVAPSAIARMDARQSNPDRYRAFLRCLDDEPLVIIGNRSAVYAPAHNLGLIVVWDDGDRLFAEPLSPYVHTRDAALIRQRQQNCSLMFIAHTRSVDVQRLVDVGWVRSIAADPAVLPRIIVTAGQPGSHGAESGARIPSSAWQLAADALSTGPVLVQVARPGYAPVLACGSCAQAARCGRCGGPLAIARSGATPTCKLCGAIAADWVCPSCGGTRLRLVSKGAGRTAEELGRAFPGTRIIIADGERPVLSVDASPALVVATPGAEPIAAGGYRAVLLVDGERMLARESLRVAEDCLRWWSNATALASPGAPIALIGVGGQLAQALATWRQDAYAASELIDRRELRFPPAVRVASVTGRADAVAATTDALEPGTTIDVLGPVAAGEGTVRSIVRFGYAHGEAVAAALRSAVIKAATTRRSPRSKDGRSRATLTLKVRFDDPEIL